MISYYCITLPITKTTTRVTTLVSKGLKRDAVTPPNKIPTIRYSTEGTKAIIKAEITSEMKAWISSNRSYVEYLGDMLPNGQAEQKVYDFIKKNAKDWISSADEEVQDYVKTNSTEWWGSGP